jgi:hypothetical protein
VQFFICENNFAYYLQMCPGEVLLPLQSAVLPALSSHAGIEIYAKNLEKVNIDTLWPLGNW